MQRVIIGFFSLDETMPGKEYACINGEIEQSARLTWIGIVNLSTPDFFSNWYKTIGTLPLIFHSWQSLQWQMVENRGWSESEIANWAWPQKHAPFATLPAFSLEALWAEISSTGYCVPCRTESPALRAPLMYMTSALPSVRSYSNVHLASTVRLATILIFQVIMNLYNNDISNKTRKSAIN